MSEYLGGLFRAGRCGNELSQRSSSRRQSRSGMELPVRFADGATVSLAAIIDAENLIAAYDIMASESGQAPGPDGVRFKQLGCRERADIFRDVSTWLRQGTYRPEVPRQCNIPKSSGGTRTLSVRGIVDRVVSKAVLTAIQLAVDSKLLDCSMGFRPGRSREKLLAEMEVTMIQQDRWILVTEDIRCAFDNVPVERAISALNQHVKDDAVENMIASVVRGHDGTSRQTGIDQGDPLSPLVLNALLNDVLDRPLQAACPDIPYWRYADNLIWVCQDVNEGKEVRQQTIQLLQGTGLALKDEGGPVNLKRQGAKGNVLGFQISRGGESQLKYEPDGSSWKSLEHSLDAAQEAGRPHKAAERVLSGWLEAYGPAFVDGRTLGTILQKARQTAYRLGHRESWNAGKMQEVGSRTRDRWLACLQSAYLCHRKGDCRT